MNQEIPPELLLKYQKSFPDKLRAISDLIQSIYQSPLPEKISELKNIIHKLISSASLYGYTATSEICRNFENKLTQDSSLTPLTIDDEWKTECNEYLKKIEHSLYHVK